MGRSRIPPGQTPQTVWPWILTSHAMTHAAAVGIVTGSAWLSVLELICHWCIDMAKCASLIGIHVDQSLHLGCKVVWFVMFILWVKP